MSNSPSGHQETKSGVSPATTYDQAALLSSLYGLNNYPAAAMAMYGNGGFPSGNSRTQASPSSTLGVAASQAASLGMNQASVAWYAMAQQIAAQDYLSRIQAMSNPSYAAYAAAAAAASTQQRSSSPESNSKLPAELVKQTSSSTGPKIPGSSNRGRKKTISLDPAASAAAASIFMTNLGNGTSRSKSPSVVSNSSRGSTPTIPAGLIIERKKTGGKKKDIEATQVIDKVEITKIPISGNKNDEAPLNLSTKANEASDRTAIPNEYYASQALSGAYLAEQIRQSQLAVALENRLESSSLSPESNSSALASVISSAQKSGSGIQNLQAALLMNQLKAGAAMAAQQMAKSTQSSSEKIDQEFIVNLLSKHQNGNSNNISDVEKSVTANPELTIEPIFKESEPLEKCDEKQQVVIKNVCESPEIRDLSDAESENEPVTEVSGKSGKQLSADSHSDIRLPLSLGWKRETTIREYSRSGFKGDVVYYAPCGKKIKQYPDILRYLEKLGSKDLNREHFSFSTRIHIGTFLKPTGQLENGEEKYLRLNEKEMAKDLETVKKEHGSGKTKKSSCKTNGKPESKEVDKLSELDKNMKEESTKKEMKMLTEVKRKKQEEHNKRLQEKQQAALIKEHERERRRQHLIYMKQLESKKRFDEREKRKEDIKVEKERDRERRLIQKRLESEILSELKRPCEDMTLTTEGKPLPKLKRIKGLKLSGEAFLNCLMIHEFLHNFGETLGFHMNSLPSLKSLQSAFLYNVEAEEELLSIVIHLVVCAIEDPGIIAPHKHLTIFGQTLRQADITNTNISEILKIFLNSRAQTEVKIVHGLLPPSEFKEKKAAEALEQNGQTFKIPPSEEYQSYISLTKAHKMFCYIKDKPFLSLNPTEKSAIVCFLCDELLNNKSIVAQIDNHLENIQNAKKKKFNVENKLKKLRLIQQRKYKGAVPSLFPPPKTCDSPNTYTPVESSEVTPEPTEIGSDREDDSMSEAQAISGSCNTLKKKTNLMKKKKSFSKGIKKSQKDEIFDDLMEDGEKSFDHEVHSDDDNIDDDEENLTLEELQKKIEKTAKSLVKKREELTHTINRFRANDLGQDRYRRRYWHFAHSEGIFVEAMESCEPWKSATNGMPLPDKVEPKVKNEIEFTDSDQECSSVSMFKSSMEIETASDLSKTEVIENEDEKVLLKITPNGDKLNLFNHSARFNMSLSPVVLNGSVTITPKEPLSSLLNVSSGLKSDRPWFSILPHSSPVDDNLLTEDQKLNFKSLSTPHIDMLEKKLLSVKKNNIIGDRIPIPSTVSKGWWRITDPEDIKELIQALHPRGTREQPLLVNMKKFIESVYDGSKLSLGESLCLGEEDGDPVPSDNPGSWNKDVAIRVDKYILEQVEALEDKVASASMQNPGWKVPNKPDSNDRVFRPACLESEDPLPDPISEARERLLDLELNIERRYLKAPLGYGNSEPTIQTITSSRTTQNSSKTIISEDESLSNPQDEEPTSESPQHKENIPRALQNWRDSVAKAKSAGQLAMGFYILETSIAWHKSIMKAFCQLCLSGDNEDSLLLCDGCDKGYHLYCFKPPFESVPEGDWYCFECINKATGIKHCLFCGKQEGKNIIQCVSCPRAYHCDCLSPPLAKLPRGKWQCPNCQQDGISVPASKRKNKKVTGYKSFQDSPGVTDTEESLAIDDAQKLYTDDVGGPPYKKKKYSRADKDLSACSTLISELENSEEAGPFLYPVNTKQFPTYKKVIKMPMDITTIKRKLEIGSYKIRDEFCNDVRQIFSNCELFNEDDSPVGKAGHTLRTFFENRWAELTSNHH